jgi:hypothetical protein
MVCIPPDPLLMLVEASKRREKAIARLQKIQVRRNMNCREAIQLFIPSCQLLHDVLDILLRRLWRSSV